MTAAATQDPALQGQRRNSVEPTASKPITLQPLQRLVNLDLRGGTKDVYEQVAHLFGIQVMFDADMRITDVRIRMQEADLYTAFSVLQLETGTFWQPVTAQSVIISSDTPAKRRQYELHSSQTFSLQPSADSAARSETVALVRDIVGVNHIVLDPQGHSITLRGTAEQLGLASMLLQELQTPAPEVLLQIDLLEVNRSKALQLGITPPTSAKMVPLTAADLSTLKSSTDAANLLTNLTQILTSKGISNTASIVAVGGGLSTFLLAAPATAADFADSLSLVQGGQEILLRVQEGTPATFFVGERYPVSLAQLSVGTAGQSTSVLAGTTFPVTSFSVGKNPSAIAANTFTGGTLPDLAVANRNDNTLTILQNQDTGKFTQTGTSPINLGKNALSPVALASGVLRNDPAKYSTTQPPDLVIANSASNNISVFLGNRDGTGNSNGTFTEAPGSPIPVGSNPSSVLLTDFNGDGFLDIAVTNQGDDSISLFRGNGDGTFTEFPNSPVRLPSSGTTSQLGPVGIVSGNFRNKYLENSSIAEVDLAVANQKSNTVSILLSSLDAKQNLTFTEAPGSPLAVGNSPVAIASADLNSDGVLDLAVVNQADNSVTIALGSTNLDGTFTAAQGSPLQTGSSPAGIAIADFTSDGVPDLAITNEGVATLGVYVGLGSGTFASRIELSMPAGPTAVIAATLTSSGLPDVALVANNSGAQNGIAAIVQDSSNFATGTANTGQSAYPQIEYEDLGVKAKATARIHSEQELTLQLDLEIRALSGTNANGIPILTSTTISQTVRLKEGNLCCSEVSRIQIPVIQ